MLLGREDNFWQSGPHGPCGPARSSTSIAGSTSARRRPTGRRHRALPRVLEPRVHAVRAARRRLADRSAAPEHRHGAGPRPDGGDPPGRPVGLRDEPLHAADRARRGALGQDIRQRLRHDAGAARSRRPRPRRHLPAGRRRGALERGPRLRAAPDHAPRDPAGARARDRVVVPAEAVRARDRGDGRGLSGPARAGGHDRALGEGGGGELRPHARAGRAHAGGHRRAGEVGRDLMGVGRGRVPAARHLRLPLRDDQGAAGRGRPGGRRPGLRGADGAGARDLAGRRRPCKRRSRRRPARGARAGAALRPGGRLPHASSWATRRPRRRA